MAKELTLSILVVNYNTRSLTLACLRSVMEETSGIDYEIIVVDNASEDGSVEAIREAFPEIVLIPSPENLGFAGGNNLAAKSARGKYILLLNSDTVVRNGALQKLVAFAEAHPDNGIWGGRTIFADGSLNPISCFAAATPWSVFCRATGLDHLFRHHPVFFPQNYPGWQRDTVREVQCVSGCFLLITRKLWEELGGFDEDFFMYGEDEDLSLRARQAGARPLICPEAEIIHYGGKSEKIPSGKWVKLLTARIQLVDRHWPRRWRPFGHCLFALWSLRQYLGWSFLKLLGIKKAKAGMNARTYREVWRRRAEWLRGGKPAGNLAKPKKIMAISSGGGHWAELMRLQPALQGHKLIYVCIHPSYQKDVPGEKFYAVQDANQEQKLRLLKCLAKMIYIVLKERPEVVLSTGAAPGLLGLVVAKKLLGARTLWLDSIANGGELSLSGRLAEKYADLWLTQWEHLATANGPYYYGGII